MKRRGLNKLGPMVLASPEAGVGSNCLLHGTRREGGEEALVFVFWFFAMRSLQSHFKQQWVVGAVLLPCCQAESGGGGAVVC